MREAASDYRVLILGKDDGVPHNFSKNLGKILTQAKDGQNCGWTF